MSGGIWILWNSPDIKIKEIQAHKQFLHCEVSGIGKESWFFTAIYASPREMERRELWRELLKISKTLMHPWMLAGDFNDIKVAEEQRGGAKVDERKCRRFCNNIESCKLIDLRTEGSHFTWRSPVISYANRLYKKLDRVLCNGAWQKCFGEVVIKIGPRTQSDHNPLLIDTKPLQKRVGERPFRFEAA